MTATVTTIRPRRTLPMDELLAMAQDIAAGAAIPAEDELYRRTVLARLGGACCEVVSIAGTADE